MRAMVSPRQESDSLDVQVLVDSIPALIHTGRSDGYLAYFNQRWLQYVGLPLEDLLGWKWTAAIHSEDVESMVNRWRSSIASGEAFLHEARAALRTRSAKQRIEKFAKKKTKTTHKIITA